MSVSPVPSTACCLCQRGSQVDERERQCHDPLRMQPILVLTIQEPCTGCTRLSHCCRHLSRPALLVETPLLANSSWRDRAGLVGNGNHLPGTVRSVCWSIESKAPENRWNARFALSELTGGRDL